MNYFLLSQSSDQHNEIVNSIIHKCTAENDKREQHDLSWSSPFVKREKVNDAIYSSYDRCFHKNFVFLLTERTEYSSVKPVFV